MSQVQTADVRSVALSLLVPSNTEAQQQRRKHFDKVALEQLAASIKNSGIVNPILVRPTSPYHVHSIPAGSGQGWYVWRDDGKKGKGERVSEIYSTEQEARDARRALVMAAPQTTFEIVAGERRYQAAKLAALDQVPVSIRELTDDQVLELQLIENLQREGLHELHEAEGYEQLRKRGMTSDEIAAKVGRSREYVYARMKLLALSKESREAFYDGKINASVALLIARIPVEKLQKEALKRIVQGWRGNPMSYREALEFVQDEFMLRLETAPFDTADAALLPSAKACGACPKNTLAAPSLFGDVKGGSAGVCTDPVCFKSKIKAHGERLVAKAKETGKKVITGADAKKVFPYDNDRSPSYNSGLHDPDGRDYRDPKNRTYRQLAGKDAETVLVVHPHTNAVYEFLADATVKAGMKKQGISFGGSSSSSSAGSQPSKASKAATEKAAAKTKLELAVRGEIAKQMSQKAPKPLHRDELELIVDILGESAYFDHDGELNKFINTIDKNRKTLNEAALLKLARLFAFADAIEDAHAKTDRFFAAAKRAGVNVEAVRKTVEAAAAKDAPAKADTKKAAGKKK